MRDRAISSIGVVAVGLVPAFIGGPVFALVLSALMLIGYSEFRRIAARLDSQVSAIGFGVLIGFAIFALAGGREEAVLGGCAAAVAFPLIRTLTGPIRPAPGAMQDWVFSSAGTLYLALPLFSGIAIRQDAGPVESAWLSDLTDTLSLGWDAAPRGLGWLLIVILATWFGDTGAYLVGRSLGRRPLLPAVSPKKTIEGSVGGLSGSMLAGGLGVVLFGLGVPWFLGIAFGLVLGIVGQVGDLSESLLKRQAGVKDSGTLIRGHGGILDRIDALIFALVAGFVLIPLVERWS